MKLFKKILFISLIFFSFIYTQDIEGNYKLTGLSAVYYDFVRQETSVVITDNYGIGISAVGDTYAQGEAVQYDYQLPTPEAYLNSAGVQLYVNFYTDGTAEIADGSYYPTSTTENCISSLSSLPISGPQGYSSNLNSGATIPQNDIVGLPSKSIYAGQSSGSCSITSSPVFDIFPQAPAELTIPFPINTVSISEEFGNSIPANTILPGQTAGYTLFDNKLVSTIEQNEGTRPSLYLEWHAIDGPVNESGLGDIIGTDEDGDGTDYDGIYGLRTPRVTKINLGGDCGSLNYPIAGKHISGLQSIKEQQCTDGNLDNDCTTYAENWISDCINHDFVLDTLDTGNLYAFDQNASSSLWGGIITYNSISYNVTQNPTYLVDDSNVDYDEACEEDDDHVCAGRLLFSYTPQCLPSFSVRYFMAELTELCEASEQDECDVCGGDGPVTWYNDADRDGLGDPNNFKTNCLPGYCIEDELLSYSECNDANNSWDWLSMGICSDGNGNELPNPTALGDFEFCNYIMDNAISGYENATWDWDRGFSTNNLDLDDTCINIDAYHNCTGGCINDADEDNICDETDEHPNCASNIVDCNGDCDGTAQDIGCGCGEAAAIEYYNCDDSCINDADEDNICDETDEHPNCASNIVDCNGDCDGTAQDIGCGCGEAAAIEYYNCDDSCINDADEDSICDELEILGCTDIEAQNYNIEATDDDESCEYLENTLSIIPEKFEIQSVYPNPFNPVVTISYGVPTSQLVEGSIYNLAGELVSTVISQYHSAGNYSIKWNATGKPSGIYIFILKTEFEVKSQKLVLLK